MDGLLGAVLCGGESSRMGTDKGLIEIKGKHWAELVADKLRGISVPVAISINRSQERIYSSLFRKEELIPDNSELKGPLNGLLSVHEQRPEKDILILACDMLDITALSLEQVIYEYRSGPGFDFYCYHHNGFFEPFCGIYTSHGLKKIHQHAKAHQLHNFSFQYVLNSGKTKKIPLSAPSDFRNRNAPHQ